MTDVVLARKLAAAMAIAIEIRNGEVSVPHAGGPRLVAALNDCFDHIAPDLDARNRYYRDVLADIEAEAGGV
ncbi:MAG: hypothetical protein ACRDIL_01150 [Candidatus Limnocylindrales bacterium]